MKHTKIFVNFNEQTNIKNFFTKVLMLDADIDAVRGRYTINGKSILGVLSLDLSSPVEMHIHTDMSAAKAFTDSISNLLVGEITEFDPNIM